MLEESLHRGVLDNGNFGEFLHGAGGGNFRLSKREFPVALLTALRGKHNVDVKLCKMPSVYKTPPFNGEILLEFVINTLQQLKNKYSFAKLSNEILRKFARATC